MTDVTVINYQTQDIVNQMMKLFPQWQTFPFEPGSTQSAMITAIGQMFGRIAAVAQNMPSDTFPTTTVDLINEWMASVGLPDPLIPVTTLSQQQAQVGARIMASDSPTIPFFKGFAAGLAGCLSSQVRITVYQPFYANWQCANRDVCAGIEAAFMWQIAIPSAYSTEVSLVQAEVLRIAPAHTVLLGVVTY